MRKLIGCVLALLMIVLLSPWFTGMWFQRTYQNVITFYNLQGGFNIDLMKYHRGWWASDATLQIEVIDPDVLRYFSELGINNPKLTVTFYQHIQHGPVILDSSASSTFGLAFIRNAVNLSKDLRLLVQSVNADQPLVVNVNDFVTFFGEYYKSFTVSPFKLMDINKKTMIQFNQGSQGSLWIFPNNRRMNGNIALQSVLIMNGKNVITIPTLSLQFKQYRTPSGLWLGQSGVMASDVTWLGENDLSVHLSDINFHGTLDEKAGEIYGRRYLDIKQIEVAGRSIGPVHLQMSASGLSVKGVLNLIAAYQKIMRRGELYESQLSQNMSSLVPTLFSTNTEVTIDGLNVDSPDGNLQLSAKMNWPFNESSADGVYGLYQDANAQAQLRVSKELLNKIINDISQLSYFRSITSERRDELIDLQNNLQSAGQRNFLFISQLVRDGVISEDQALELLAIQKNDASLEEYFSTLKKMYLDRQISRQLTYMLFWQYADVKQHVAMLDQAFDVDQKIVKQQMHDQITQWIKEGYITQDKNDYVISVHKDNVSVKVNGKEL